MVSPVPLVVGTTAARAVAVGLSAAMEMAPSVDLDEAWSSGPIIESWRDDVAAGAPVDDVVVAVWSDILRPTPLVEEDLEGWISTMETPFVLWFAAMAAASQRCADGGQVVAVVDRPDPKHGANWGSEAAVADAVENMARSFALVHGDRGVRVNVVTSSHRLEGRHGPAGSATGLDDVVAAVAMLLADRSGSVSGAVLHLGGGQ